MEKEIGGYLEFENYNGEEYHKNAIPLNCGRNALSLLIKLRNYTKVYIPYFSCDAINNGIEKVGCSLEYYNINSDLSVIFDKTLKINEAILIINYYGQLSNKEIYILKKKYNNIIVDNTQAFFQRPVKNVDTIYSCRKFFGVSDGAYLVTNCTYEKLSFQQDVSFERFTYVLGRYEKNASTYFNLASNNNNLFDNESIKFMSKLTQNLMKSFDYKNIAKKRFDNFNFLYKQLNCINKLHLKKINGAFMYPLLVSNGNMLRKQLQEKNIFIPCLWPNVLNINIQCNETYLAENILPLPCDQRYNISDMQFIVDSIISILNF